MSVGAQPVDVECNIPQSSVKVGQPIKEVAGVDKGGNRYIKDGKIMGADGKSLMVRMIMLIAMFVFWLRRLLLYTLMGVQGKVSRSEEAPTIHAHGSPKEGVVKSNVQPTRPVSFTNVLDVNCSHKKENFRSFVNEEKVENFDTVLPRYAIDKVKNKYENSLVGYFIGESLAFPVVQNYTPNLPLKKDEVTKVHVWVKMHKVPLVSYSEDSLSLISTQIGKPLMLDAFTCLMCVESLGRISFARALVKICSDSELKREVTMVVPNEDDKCPKIVRKPETFVPSMEKQSDGFTEVTSKKNKGKKGVNQQPHLSHIGGIRLNKPKPSFTGLNRVRKKAHDKAASAKSMDHGKASTSSTKSSATNTLANSFEVLTSLAGDDGVASIPSSSTGDQGVESNETDVYVSSIVVVKIWKKMTWMIMTNTRLRCMTNLISGSRVVLGNSLFPFLFVHKIDMSLLCSG
ncbi:nucleotide-binding alpha-beta plait domain-containing protein [Tanacetum coccineum]